MGKSEIAQRYCALAGGDGTRTTHEDAQPNEPAVRNGTAPNSPRTLRDLVLTAAHCAKAGAAVGIAAKPGLVPATAGLGGSAAPSGDVDVNRARDYSIHLPCLDGRDTIIWIYGIG